MNPARNKNFRPLLTPVCVQYPEFSKGSVYAKEGPVDRADYVEREKELQEAISEKNSEIFRVQKELSEREIAHKKQTQMLERALAERSNQLKEEEKKGREARKEEEVGLNDYKAVMEKKLLVADTRAVEADKNVKKQFEHAASEEADRQRRPSPLESLSILRKEERREGRSARFNSARLSEKLLALTVEVVLARAEIAMILGKWSALEEYGKYASELAAELDFEPLSERCKFFEDVALISLIGSGKTRTPKVYDYEALA